MRRGAAPCSACEQSLKRLKTDRIDLYLLHWRGGVPFAETLEALLALQTSGKIRHYGVSNLDLADMQELWPLKGGAAIATNQLLYNLTRRGIEWDLLPWLRERRIPVMAYSPLEQARLVNHAKLAAFARRHGMTPAQAALAWLLAKDDIIVIPESGAPRAAAGESGCPRPRADCRTTYGTGRPVPATARAACPGNAVTQQAGASRDHTRSP